MAVWHELVALHACACMCILCMPVHACASSACLCMHVHPLHACACVCILCMHVHACASSACLCMPVHPLHACAGMRGPDLTCLACHPAVLHYRNSASHSERSIRGSMPKFTSEGPAVDSIAVAALLLLK